jgi:hypothetical protein
MYLYILLIYTFFIYQERIGAEISIPMQIYIYIYIHTHTHTRVCVCVCLFSCGQPNDDHVLSKNVADLLIKIYFFVLTGFILYFLVKLYIYIYVF